MEKRGFQIVLALAACVPVFGGMYGLWEGVNNAAPALQSHYHYLSGLLLGIGLGFFSCVRAPENKTARFQTLIGIVLIGGVARLVFAVSAGVFSPVILFTLFMELVVPPCMAYWQRRIARGTVSS